MPPMSLMVALKVARIPSGKAVEITTVTGVRRLARHDGKSAFLGERTHGRVRGVIWKAASPAPLFTNNVAEPI